MTWDPTWYAMQAETAVNVSKFNNPQGIFQEVSTVAYNDISCATNAILPINDPTGLLNECNNPRVVVGNEGTCGDGSACTAGYTCDCADPDPVGAVGCLKINGVFKSPCRTRKVFPGASLMGWSVGCRDQAKCPAGVLSLASQLGQQFQSSISWINRRITIPPQGVSVPTAQPNGTTQPQTWNILWGDPTITHNPVAPWSVFLANLAGTSQPAEGTAIPRLNGACIARSDDGGVNFSLWRCLRGPDPLPGSSTSYDGGSLAVDPLGGLYAAYWDLANGKIDVWRLGDTNSGGNFALLPNPLAFDPDSKAVGHPILRVSPLSSSGTFRAYLMIPVRKEGILSLLLVVWDGTAWGFPTIISEDFAHNAFFGFGIGTDGFPLRLRTAKQFAFDVGVNEFGAEEARYAFTSKSLVEGPFGVCDDGTACTGTCPDPGHSCRKLAHIQAGACSPFSSGGSVNLACADAPEWTSLNGTLKTERTDQFNPLVAFAPGDATTEGAWKILYKTRQFGLHAVCPDGSSCDSSLTCSIPGLCTGGLCPDGAPCSGSSGDLCDSPASCVPSSIDDRLATVSSRLIGGEIFTPFFAQFPMKMCSTRLGFSGDYDGLIGINRLGGGPRFLTAFTDTTIPNQDAPPPSLDVDCERSNNEEANPVHVGATFLN